MRVKRVGVACVVGHIYQVAAPGHSKAAECLNVEYAIYRIDIQLKGSRRWDEAELPGGGQREHMAYDMVGALVGCGEYLFGQAHALFPKYSFRHDGQVFVSYKFVLYPK